MDPLIAEFPNRAWYSGQLQNGPRTPTSAAVRAALQAVRWPHGPAQPVAFVNVPHGAEARAASGSIMNRSEACAIVQCLRALLRHSPGLAARRGAVAVLTSYSAQRKLIQAEVRRGTAHSSDGELWGGAVVVSTVDAFQGQEASIVLLCLVRANPRGSVGFQADWRRFNVAITRARDALLVFGNRPTLLSNAGGAATVAVAAAAGDAPGPGGALASWVQWAEAAGLQLEAQPEQDDWAVPSWLHRGTEGATAAAAAVKGAESGRIAEALQDVNSKILEKKRQLLAALKRRQAERGVDAPDPGSSTHAAAAAADLPQLAGTTLAPVSMPAPAPVTAAMYVPVPASESVPVPVPVPMTVSAPATAPATAPVTVPVTAPVTAPALAPGYAQSAATEALPSTTESTTGPPPLPLVMPHIELPGDAAALLQFARPGVDAWEAAQLRGHVIVDQAICSLCRRQMKSSEMLEKHVRASHLHSTKLDEAWAAVVAGLSPEQKELFDTLVEESSSSQCQPEGVAGE